MGIVQGVLHASPNPSGPYAKFQISNMGVPAWFVALATRCLSEHQTYRLNLSPEQTPQQQSLKILCLPGHGIHISVAIHLSVQQSVV